MDWIKFMFIGVTGPIFIILLRLLNFEIQPINIQYFLADPVKLCQDGWGLSPFSGLSRHVWSGLSHRSVWVTQGHVWQRCLWATIACTSSAVLGSLSCWNMTFQPSPRFLRALDQVFITLLTHLFLTLTFIPVPASEIHPPLTHCSMMLPPPIVQVMSGKFFRIEVKKVSRGFLFLDLCFRTILPLKAIPLTLWLSLMCCQLWDQCAFQNHDQPRRRSLSKMITCHSKRSAVFMICIYYDFFLILWLF